MRYIPQSRFITLPIFSELKIKRTYHCCNISPSENVRLIPRKKNPMMMRKRDRLSLVNLNCRDWWNNKVEKISDSLSAIASFAFVTLSIVALQNSRAISPHFHLPELWNWHSSNSLNFVIMNRCMACLWLNGVSNKNCWHCQIAKPCRAIWPTASYFCYS